MAYTYRFLDSENRVIYVGYTGQSMAKRIGQHFEKGHLPKKAYKSIAITYIFVNYVRFILVSVICWIKLLVLKIR